MDVSVLETPQPPTLAILTYDDGKRIFRGNRDNYIDLIRTGKECGVDVYVTTTQDFRLGDSETIGYVYDFTAKKWRKRPVPLPHVVYNRIPFRKFELLPEVQQTLQSCLRHGQIQLFNPSFFNKWTLFEWLNKSKDTRPYVPVTHKLTSSEELENLLQQHQALYLKPVRGKAGKGIMKVGQSTSKLRPRGYQLSIQEKTQSHISRYPSVPQLWSQIREMTAGQEYIVQQAIPLATYKGRPFDLRVLAQKNAKGLWTITGVGARLAGKLSITTHVPRGGSIDDPQKLLASSFGAAGGKRIIQSARRTAIVLAKQIEHASGTTLGEMSMDLGVDAKGNLWFFEANSKPMKFDEPHIRKKSLENLVNYSAFLAKATQKKRSSRSASSLKKASARRAKQKKSG